MIVYYRDATVEVTSSAIRIHDHEFRLTDLEYVWHEEVVPTRRVRLRALDTGMVGVGIPIVGLLAVGGVVYLVASSISGPGPVVAVLLPLALLMLLLAFTGPIVDWAMNRLDRNHDLGSSVHEIWAVWRHKRMMLLRIDDELRFGQVYRSIQRAIEQQG